MSQATPPAEPHDYGMLEVGDGHSVYYECVGNPDGTPVLYLHGGPGSGASVGQRRFFDPDLHRGVIFDQRGSGRSTPLASDPDADLSTNTTHHLIRDAEALRTHLGVDRWIVLGLSWGTTLGLAYAQAHPDRVRGLVLGLVTTTSRREVDWITEGVGRIFPSEWERFAGAVPEHLRHLRLVDAYAEMLFDPDPEVRDRAAGEWCRWEDAHVSLDPGFAPNPRFDDAEFRLRFARLVTHYWRHAAFLKDDQLIRDAPILNGIPGSLIHGRYDVSSPLETAWRLSRQWETSELHVMGKAGHGGGEELLALISDSLARFART
ncbi:MAG: prolyl aminopeptidase [Acidimicrobiia bacterium]